MPSCWNTFSHVACVSSRASEQELLRSVRRIGRLHAARSVEQSEEVLACQQAENEQDDRSAATDRRSAPEAAKSAAAAATIFNIGTDSAWCPSHGQL
jgi:hypothetical protein